MGDSTYNNQNTIYNQMIPENIYGLQSNNCRMHGNCLPNTFKAMQNDPALHEIASFNGNSQAQRPYADSLDNPNNEKPSLMQATEAYDLGGSTSGELPQFPNSLQDIPGVAKIERADAMPEPITPTPATTLPSGATLTASLSSNLGIPYNTPITVTPESIQFHNGFMRSQIGRRVTVDFQIGPGNVVQKSGYLLGVAQDYILLNELDTNDITTCDYYNIKFMRFYY